MKQNMTKPVSIALIAVMIVALGGWILQWQAADDDVAQAESCRLAQTALQQGTLDGAPLTAEQRAGLENELSGCGPYLP